MLGGIPVGIAGAVYNWIAFGQVTKISYGEKSGHRGLFGVAVPRLSILARILFGNRGLLLVTPLVLVAVAAAVIVAVKPGPARVDAVVGLACFLALLALQSAWSNPWGGDSPGPRYLITALPFLAPPLAVAWSRLRVIAVLTAVWGALCMTCAVITNGTVVNLHLSLFSWWRSQLDKRLFTPTVFTMGVGGWGWMIHAAPRRGSRRGSVAHDQTARRERSRAQLTSRSSRFELVHLVAQARGLFEAQIARGLVHLVGEALDQPAELVAREVETVGARRGRRDRPRPRPRPRSSPSSSPARARIISRMSVTFLRTVCGSMPCSCSL